MKIQRITYLSLGTNQGNKLSNLQDAIDLIAEKAGAILKISNIQNDLTNVFIPIFLFLNFLFHIKLIFSKRIS